jgi:hypothetical protein
MERAPSHPIGPLPAMKTSVSRTASLKGDLEWSTLPWVWYWWTKLLIWVLESLRGIVSGIAHGEKRTLRSGGKIVENLAVIKAGR